MFTPVESVEEIFTQLSPEDEVALVALPYRVGLFVSYSDISGGWEAQEREMQSLTAILREFSEDFCKSEFTQKVLMESLRRRSDWPSWSHNIETVPEEAARIVASLKSFFDDKALYAFKTILVDIALSVAMAFRETSQRDDVTIKTSLIDSMFDAISRLRGGSQTYSIEHTNISRSERAALKKFCKAIDFSL